MSRTLNTYRLVVWGQVVDTGRDGITIELDEDSSLGGPLRLAFSDPEDDEYPVLGSRATVVVDIEMEWSAGV